MSERVRSVKVTVEIEIDTNKRTEDMEFHLGGDESVKELLERVAEAVEATLAAMRD